MVSGSGGKGVRTTHKKDDVNREQPLMTIETKNLYIHNLLFENQIVKQLQKLQSFSQFN